MEVLFEQSILYSCALIIRLFDVVVLDNVTLHKTVLERSVYSKGHRTGIGSPPEFEIYKLMTYSKPTQKMTY